MLIWGTVFGVGRQPVLAPVGTEVPFAQGQDGDSKEASSLAGMDGSTLGPPDWLQFPEMKESDSKPQRDSQPWDSTRSPSLFRFAHTQESMIEETQSSTN